VEFDPAALPPNAMYKLLISSVVPRPIAWVSHVHDIFEMKRPNPDYRG
jgi:hypothetical protein